MEDRLKDSSVSLESHVPGNSFQIRGIYDEDNVLK